MYTRKGKIHTLLHFLIKWIDKDRKMIRLSKDRVLEDFFIDDNGVITNKEGEVQKIYYIRGRSYFKATQVHQIQMWTKYGWRDTKIWAIHHIDEDKTNNAISNLVFMTRSEHMRLHRKGYSSWNKGKKFTEEHKKNLSEVRKGKYSGSKNPSFGKIWWTNGESNLYLKIGEIPPCDYYRGMTKRWKK